jgi:hypothetical protein
MSFAAFILKLEADAKGVEKGVNVAQTHLKRLGGTVKDIESRATKEKERQKREAEARLKPEEKLNQLLRTREQVLNRINRVDDPRTRNLYLQKQLEIEKQITAAKEKQAANTLRGRIGAAGGNLLGRLGGARGAAIGAAVAGGATIGGAAVMGANTAIEDNDIAQQNGMTVGDIQRLRFSAKASRADFGQLLQVVLDIQKNRSQALLGDEGATKNFKRLGFSREKLAGQSAGDTAFSLFDMVGSGKINSNNMAAFFAVAEQGAKNILPALNRGLSEAARNFQGVDDGLSGSVALAAQVFSEGKAGVGNMVSTSKVGQFFRGAIQKGLGLVGLDAPAGNIQAMQGTLDLKQAERNLKESQAQEEARDWYRRWKAGEFGQDTKRGSRMGSGNHIDSDELARIGLFRGGASASAPVTERLDRIHNQLKELTDEVREE